MRKKRQSLRDIARSNDISTINKAITDEPIVSSSRPLHPHDRMTDHERKITLHSEPISGTMDTRYWVTCSDHGQIGPDFASREFDGRRWAIIFHLKGYM
jgi:hypothetical protein